MAMVWRTTLKGAELLVMDRLAFYADDNGEECYPSLETLSVRTHYGERMVRYALRKLAKRGFISMDVQAHTNGNGQATNQYHVNIEALRGATFAPQGGQSLLPKGGNLCQKGGQGLPTILEEKDTESSASAIGVRIFINPFDVRDDPEGNIPWLGQPERFNNHVSN